MMYWTFLFTALSSFVGYAEFAHVWTSGDDFITMKKFTFNTTNQTFGEALSSCWKSGGRLTTSGTYGPSLIEQLRNVSSEFLNKLSNNDYFWASKTDITAVQDVWLKTYCHQAINIEGHEDCFDKEEEHMSICRQNLNTPCEFKRYEDFVVNDVFLTTATGTMDARNCTTNCLNAATCVAYGICQFTSTECTTYEATGPTVDVTLNLRNNCTVYLKNCAQVEIVGDLLVEVKTQTVTNRITTGSSFIDTTLTNTDNWLSTSHSSREYLTSNISLLPSETEKSDRFDSTPITIPEIMSSLYQATPLHFSSSEFLQSSFMSNLLETTSDIKTTRGTVIVPRDESTLSMFISYFHTQPVDHYSTPLDAFRSSDLVSATNSHADLSDTSVYRQETTAHTTKSMNITTVSDMITSFSKDAITPSAVDTHTHYYSAPFMSTVSWEDIMSSCEISFQGVAASAVDVKNPPSCSCGPLTQTQQLTRSEKSKIIEKMIESLTINRTTVSATRRRYTSATDDRPICKGAGSVGIALVAIPLIVMIALDFVGLVRDICYGAKTFSSK